MRESGPVGSRQPLELVPERDRLHIARMAELHPPVGWFVHVKTADIEDTPTITRHFYVAEPDRARAELIAADLGETAEAIHPLSQQDLDRLKLAPGEKMEHDYEP